MDLRPLWEPVGPLPASTYWWRRAFVALVVLAVALISALAATAGGSKTPKTVGGPTVTKPPPIHVSPPVKPATKSAVIPTCADADLSVVAGTDAATYPTGVQPRFALVIKNVSARACRRDIGSDARGYTVRSGADRVWSTDDCNTGATAAVATLQPGQPVSFHRVWDRRRSKPGCPTGEPTALGGTYRLYVHIGGVVSGPTVFVLR